MANRCEHKNLPLVPYDHEAAKALPASEVRRRWPRLMQKCPDCKDDIICYASSLHYYSGDR